MKMKQLFIILTYLCYVPFSLMGQLKSWDGGAGTSHWHDSDNWDPNGVPTSFNDVNIPSSLDSVYVNGNAACNSIISVGDLVIPHNAELRISGLNIDKAIYLLRGCSLENEGGIIIEGAQESGLFIDDCVMTNKNSGSLEIFNSDNYGIFLEEGRLVNQSGATIMISDIDGDAITNKDTITNRGIIDIDNCGDGIANEGVFKNSEKAELIIRKSFNGLENYSLFSNAGNITITKFQENGIFNDDDDNSAIAKFVNQGDILIDSLGDDGIYNKAYFLNDTTGGIIIQNSVDPQSNGIFNSDTIDNNGSLVIRDINSIGIFCSGFLFYNTGLTRIVRCDEHGVLIDDESFFRNEKSSELTIVDCTVPIEVEIGSLFNCKGIISFED